MSSAYEKIRREPTHEVLARDVAHSPKEWAGYLEALAEHGFSPGDGMGLLITLVTNEPNGSDQEPHPWIPRTCTPEQQAIFHEVVRLCCAALHYASQYLELVVRCAGPERVRAALRTATQAVRDGNDPRCSF
jgi:hypothetical protein